MSMKKDKSSYHHGNLAESLVNAVDEIASKFGLEAVTLRACAKLVGVSLRHSGTIRISAP